MDAKTSVLYLSVGMPRRGNTRQEAPELVTNSGVVNDPALRARATRALEILSPRRVERGEWARDGDGDGAARRGR